MQPLVRRETCSPFAFESINHPVKNQLGERKNDGACQNPDESAMDQAMGGHQVDPEIRRTHFSIGEFGWLVMTIFPARKKFSLKGEIREGVANHESKK